MRRVNPIHWSGVYFKLMITFHLLTGLSGSGKTTYAKDIKDRENCVLLSSDDLRKEFYGDENIQENPAFIFEQMRIRTLQALKEGKNVIYDATNLSSKRRKALLKQLPKDVYKICHCIVTPLDKCIENDTKRERHVSESVIMRQLEQFQMPWYDEGWNDIIIVKPFGDAKLNINLNIKHDCPKWHKDDTVADHIRRVVEAVKARLDLDRWELNILLKVAEFHDIGKPYVKTFYNTKGELCDNAHYYNHENVGAYLYLSIIDTPYSCITKNIYDTTLFIAYLINNHMVMYNNQRKFSSLEPHVRRLLQIFNECDKEGA